MNITIDVPQPYNKIGDGPEGPEVARMTQFFKQYTKNNDLISIKIIGDKYTLPTINLPTKVANVYSHGKKTIVELENGWYLFVSYSMTGHWEIHNNKHAWLRFKFGAKKLYWVCPRTWGKVKFLRKTELDIELAKLGLDIFKNPSKKEILAVYPTRGQNICRFLMDQSRFCGVGNYLKAMILYQMKISPYENTKNLSTDEKLELWQTAQRIAQTAFKARGMGMRDYKDENGKRVGVAFDTTPYNRKKAGKFDVIKEKTPDTRMTWWVPDVQRLK